MEKTGSRRIRGDDDNEGDKRDKRDKRDKGDWDDDDDTPAATMTIFAVI